METKKREINLDGLSSNLLNIILEFLDQDEISLLGATCKRLKLVSETEANRRKFNELVFIKGSTCEVLTLNLDSLLTTKHYDLSHKLFSFGSVYIPCNQSTFFYGGWTGTEYIGEAFLISKNKNIMQLPSGPPAGRISLTYYKNYIYAIGGHESSLSVKYNLTLNTWEECAPLNAISMLQTTCALITDNILITGYYFTKLMKYDINNESLDSIKNLTLNGHIFKNIFTVRCSVYIIEVRGNTYTNRSSDLSNWEIIGTNDLNNYSGFSHSVRYKDKVYFIQARQKLVEFNLKDKTTKEIKDL
ncbi:unnamed protein product [Blepharisma stoltei]|uniref:F-box domain-containing protein n=1 Tax=Blepharisma stoltei TaxID=1481888 RepID=A0AAU9IQG1_9CILI|nr:unnamed protein product [Blepharisma stoltei]